jgi:signal recognition particle GTPase
MKTTLKTLLIASAFILPLGGAYADDLNACNPGEHNCALTDHMVDMQKGMGDMSGKMRMMDEHMQQMMQKTSDPAMKQEMESMHKDMGDMMKQCQQMREKMGKMSGMMQQGGMDKQPAAAPSGSNAEDHKKHH